MVRIGTVNAVDGARARVFFPETGLMSDWLYVLRHPGSGESGEAQEHRHGISFGNWSPQIGDTAVVLYPDGVFNADGYLLGVIG